MEHERLPRKLAAVLYADVVGYSRLMGEAEDATHRTLAAHLDLFAATVTRRQGRVVHYAGDAVLARFDAALDALACAIEIQRELAVRNADPLTPRKVEFRIGVNLGDVIEDRGDIYGDGVNTAARLQELAEPGQICVSQSVRTAVGNRLPVAFTDMGERTLKNIEHRVRAYRVRTPLGADAAGAGPGTMRARSWRRRLDPFATRRNTYAALLVLALAAAGGAASVIFGRIGADTGAVTVAVLPFANLSGDVEQEYFVDGMTEALITSLAKLRGLNVISRTSIMRYKDTEKSLPEIARELGATAIVEGSAQLEGDQVRITAQLIDTANDLHLWVESYDRPFQDILRLQSEIARRVATDVEVAIAPAEAERLDAARAVDVETYRAYLRGMYFLHKETRDGAEQGLKFLHDAVDRDPGDALAHAGLALGYAVLGHGSQPQVDAWPRARAAAERAIALDPGLAEAYAALADVKLYMEWDWEGAERAFVRANELSPSLAMNHYHYAWYLALFDRWDEAIAEHRRAQELDPLTPFHTAWLAGLYVFGDRDLGRNQEAVALAERALELEPDNPTALLTLGWAYSAGGQHERAIETGHRLVEVEPAHRWQLGLSYARAGRMDDVRAVLAEVESEPVTSWTALGRANLHAQLGDLDSAFQWLAHEPPHAWVPWMRNDRWFSPVVEDDPRYAAFLERLRLPR